MKIHFVCSGNTYRSRLAEAYLNSLKLKGITAVSSGTHAKKQPMEIRWYTERILEKYNLSRFASKLHRQTTAANLNACDKIIFFEPGVYAFCKKNFPIKKPYIVWNVKDLYPHQNDMRVEKISEKSFKEIKGLLTFLVGKFDR